MKLMGDVVYNKDIWVFLSGTVVPASAELAEYELNRSAKQLFHGINYYQKPGSNAATEEDLKAQVTAKLYAFVKKLEEFLCVHVSQVYDLLCFYVMYEYRGNPESLLSLISNEAKKTMLMQDIWLFYRSERMFLLKCIDCIWTFCLDENHPNQKQYANLVARNTVSATFATHAAQFQSVTQEAMPTIATNGLYMTPRFQEFWFASNLREQIQVLQNFALYLDFYSTCTGKEFQLLFQLFSTHRYGRSQQPDKCMTGDLDHVRELIGFLETVVLLQALDLSSIESNSYKLFTKPEIFDALDVAIETTLGHDEEHGPLLLAWMIVNYKSPTTKAELCLYRKFGDAAVRLGAFNYLGRLIRHPVFKQVHSLGKVASQCIGQLLRALSTCFEIGYLSRLPGVYNAVAAALSNRAEADRFWDEEEEQTGLWTFMSSAVMEFPHNFLPLVNLSEALTSSGQANNDKLVAMLQSLPTYSEAVNANAIHSILTPSQNPRVSILTRARVPHGADSQFLIPEGTRGVLDTGTECIMLWQYSFNFFRKIETVEKELLRQISCGSNYVQGGYVTKVVAIANFLGKLFARTRCLPPDVFNAAVVVFPLLEKCSHQTTPSGELLSALLNVATSLLSSRFKNVCHRMKQMPFFPCVDLTQCSDPAKLAAGDCLDLNVVGLAVVKDECISGKYPLLLAYLRFIAAVMEHCMATSEQNLSDNMELVLPALVMVVRVIYPNYDSWVFDEEMDKSWVGHYCTLMLHQVLAVDCKPLSSNETPEEDEATKFARDLRGEELVVERTKEMDLLRRNIRTILNTICLHSLLFTDTCVPLLKLVGSGDRYVQMVMERQPSWLMGNSVLFTSNVQLGMSVLNRVLMLKSTMHIGPPYCMIERLLYSQPLPSPAGPLATHLRVVINVVNYIYHCFNPQLPILAMRLLKRFALVFPVSMVSCLGSEARTICQTLVGRLDSDIESDDMKVALLEFMASTIVTQPGLAEAFVNLHQPTVLEEKGGCLLYACNILDQLIRDPSEVSVQIHEGVVGLIFAIWMAPTQMVCDYLRERQGFWDGLLAPLFLQHNQHEFQVYCQVISIMSQEVYWFQGKIDKNLERNLSRLFSNNQTYLKDWMEYITLQLQEKVTNGKCKGPVKILFNAWKKLITVVMKFFPSVIDVDMQRTIAQQTMKVLLQELKTTTDTKIIQYAADLYLIIIANWKEHCINDGSESLKQLTELVHLTSLAGKCLSVVSKERLLVVALILVETVSREIQENDGVANDLVQYTCTIASYELIQISRAKSKPEELVPDKLRVGQMLQIMPHIMLKEAPPPIAVINPKACELSVYLLHRLIYTLRIRPSCLVHIQQTKLINLLIDVTKFALDSPDHENVVKINLRVLSQLATTSFARTMISFDISHMLWIGLLPPKRYMIKDSKVPWYETSWCEIYELGLGLVTQLLTKETHLFVEEAVSFVGIHQEILIILLTAMRLSMNQNTLKLVIAALQLVRQLQFSKVIWEISHRSSFLSIMIGVKSSLDTCVAFLTLPHVLYVLVDKPPIRCKKDLDAIEVMEIIPSRMLIAVQNSLLECCCLSLMVLNQLWPTYLSLLTEPQEEDQRPSLMIEPTFTTPVLHQSKLGHLSFGTIITLINLCTQSLANKKGHSAAAPIAVGTSPTKAFKPSQKWLVSLIRPMVSITLQHSLHAAISQGLVAIKDRRLSPGDRVQFQREIMSELTPFLDYVKRNPVAEEGRSLKRRSAVRKLNLSPPPSSSRAEEEAAAGPSGEEFDKKVADTIEEQGTRYFHMSANVCLSAFSQK